MDFGRRPAGWDAVAVSGAGQLMRGCETASLDWLLLAVAITAERSVTLHYFATRPFAAFARASQVIRPLASAGRRARIRVLRSSISSAAIAASFAATLAP